MKTATFVKNLDWTANASLYKLSEPVRIGYNYGDDDEEDTRPTTSFVIASAVSAPFSGPETLVFPAHEDGEAIEMLEISGGRGYMCHKTALSEMGFEIV